MTIRFLVKQLLQEACGRADFLIMSLQKEKSLMLLNNYKQSILVQQQRDQPTKTHRSHGLLGRYYVVSCAIAVILRMRNKSNEMQQGAKFDAGG